MTEAHSNVEFPSRFTFYMCLCGILAASGGLMFGYDIGISGGVTAMDDFLIKFFPHVYKRKQFAKEDNYCKYDDPKLQLFTSSLYLAALVSSFAASKVCSVFGRKPTIFAASMFFLLGTGLSSGALNIIMLIFGRIFLGFGVGFGNEAVPIFLSEVAPAKHRGSVNVVFQLLVTVGIFLANTVNYYTAKMKQNGWRVSLGLAGVPTLILFIGSLVITETPTSLVEQGKVEKGRKTLAKIRGVPHVDAEFEQIQQAVEVASEIKHPFIELFKRRSWPPLIIAIWLQIFQQFTGINAIMFYAPVLFQTVGFKNDASLMSSIITGSVNVCSTFIAVFLVDKAGRKMLLLLACFLMFISQFVIGFMLYFMLTATNSLAKVPAAIIVFLVCLFVMAFAWSWGPLGWLIPSETFPLQTRTAGFAVAVSFNMLMTFIIAQVFLTMLCSLRAGIFWFFAGFIFVMGLFVVFLVPETKGVPVDDMAERVWKKHAVWNTCM